MYICCNIDNKIRPIHFYTEDQTIEMLKQGYSIGRFGDGEINICCERYGAGGFQDLNLELSKDLNKILMLDTNREEKFLIAIISTFGSFSGYNKRQKKYYAHYNFTRRNWLLRHICNRGREQKYADPLFARMWGFHEDTKQSLYNKVEKLNAIWENKRLLIVEGADCKVGINSDLLYSAKKIERIIVPSKNAFDKRTEIVELICKQKDIDIILLICGPTATVLAYDLYKLGYQAIDFGQTQKDYINKAMEFDGFKHNVQKEDLYEQQIVAQIK